MVSKASNKNSRGAQVNRCVGVGGCEDGWKKAWVVVAGAGCAMGRSLVAGRVGCAPSAADPPPNCVGTNNKPFFVSG